MRSVLLPLFPPARPCQSERLLKEAPQLADATARISRRRLTTCRYTFGRARKISVSKSLYATPLRAPLHSLVWVKKVGTVAGIERKKRSWTSPLQHLFCAPLRIVPRALLRRSGSSCTRAPRLVLLSRLRAAMVMAHSCDSDNAPRTSPQRVRGPARHLLATMHCTLGV